MLKVLLFSLVKLLFSLVKEMCPAGGSVGELASTGTQKDVFR